MSDTLILIKCSDQTEHKATLQQFGRRGWKAPTLNLFVLPNGYRITPFELHKKWRFKNPFQAMLTVCFPIRLLEEEMRKESYLLSTTTKNDWRGGTITLPLVPKRFIK